MTRCQLLLIFALVIPLDPKVSEAHWEREGAEMEPRIRRGVRAPRLAIPDDLHAGAIAAKGGGRRDTMNDPIVEEVRRIRAEIAARNGNNLRRIFEDARIRQGTDGRRVVSYDPSDVGETAGGVREEPPEE